MYTIVDSEKHIIRTDILMLIIVALLSCFGLLMLFSVSYYRANIVFNDPLYFLKRQSLWFFLGVCIAGLVASVPVTSIRKYIPTFLFISLVVLCLPFVPGIGAESLGTRRWIFIASLSFQPSELVKISLALYLAHFLSSKEKNLHDIVNTIIPLMIVVLATVFIVYLQNDFSTAVFLFVVSLLILFVGGLQLRYFALFMVLIIPIGLIFLFTKQHRVERLLAYFRPEYDPSGAGYQILVSRSALSEGGLWGRGIGQSVRKFGGLPEVQSDFIAAVLGEELGFFGIFLVMGLFVVLAITGYQLAFSSKNSFISLCSFGLTSMIFLQFLLNISVVSGLLPTTGINMPFFSAGGSSLLVTFSISAILYNMLRTSCRKESTQ